MKILLPEWNFRYKTNHDFNKKIQVTNLQNSERPLRALNTIRETRPKINDFQHEYRWNRTLYSRLYRVPDSHASNREKEPSRQITEIKVILESRRNLGNNR
jgi:hypothetical protein